MRTCASTRTLKIRSIIYGLSAILLLVTWNGALAQTNFPLRISADNRHLEDQSGEPFLINGDTPWSLFVGLTKAEAETFLEDRRSRGFNAVIANLIEAEFGGPANRDGDRPFLSPGDYSQPNEDYFAHADWVIAKAAEKDILIVLTPSYIGYGCGSEGWCQEMQGTSLSVLRAYGNFVGNRYRDADNVIWMHGGDADATEHGADAEVNAIADGIADVDPGKLITAHCYREKSAIDCYDEPWLDINNTYSDCSQSARRTRDDYQRNPVVPFFYSEGVYEGEGASQTCLRSQAYWSVLGGSTGHFFGNNPIWLLDPGWEQALASAGSRSMTHFGALFESRPWQDLVPDYAGNYVSGDRGNIANTSYVAAARVPNGNVIIAYIPEMSTVQVDMSSMSGSMARAWWYDPSDGSAQDLGVFPTSGNQNFTPPSNSDWVLVIDNDDVGFPTPGTGPPPPSGDTEPPTLENATTTVGDSDLVALTFSESLDAFSAQSAANYSIDNGISVTSASLQPDQRTVNLQTSDFSDGVNYQVSVSGVRDLANPPNTIAANSTANFVYDAGAGGGPANYVWDALSVGGLVYVDDTLVFQTVPSVVDGQQFLRTAAADSSAAGDPFAEITLAERSTVFVAYDTRNALPVWLTSWSSSTDEIDIGQTVSGARETALRLYTQEFAAGTVALGGNEMGNSMYVVVVKPVAVMPPPDPDPPTNNKSSGGAIAPLWIALLTSAILVRRFRSNQGSRATVSASPISHPIP